MFSLAFFSVVFLTATCCWACFHFGLLRSFALSPSISLSVFVSFSLFDLASSWTFWVVVVALINSCVSSKQTQNFSACFDGGKGEELYVEEEAAEYVDEAAEYVEEPAEYVEEEAEEYVDEETAVQPICFRLCVNFFIATRTFFSLYIFFFTFSLFLQ